LHGVSAEPLDTYILWELHPLKVAARVQIPLGVPMKKLALTTLLLVVVSCGGSDSGSAVPADSDFVAPTGVAV
jgi:hypothetical protein